jgi:3-ketosteroid 9alpha-monooxygenase subunit A
LDDVLCDGDGPVYQLHRWYEQFYTDVAALPVDVLEHKRFVVRASERA